MKRDARIGLAVVLVLGLFVTLLIGRALYKHSENVALSEDEVHAAEATVPVTREVDRVNGAETAKPLPHPDTAARNEDFGNGPAINDFIQDNTRTLGGESHSNPPAGLDTTKPKPPAEPLDADHGARKEVAAASTTTAPAGGYSYTIVSGDNIYKIAAKIFGDGKYSKNIVAANPGLDPKKIQAGKVIHIPEIAGKPVLLKLPAFAGKSDKAIAAAPKTDSAKIPLPTSSTAKFEKTTPATASDCAGADCAGKAETHKVQPGETLGKIARQYYGSAGPKAVARIVDANKGLDPAKLKVGQEIAIPAK
jgi:nucleoid-associated protein YgaU